MRRLWPLLLSVPSLQSADLRVGIIGTDTSHAIEFTKRLNDATHPEHVPGARVVAAFKGGSPDIPESQERVDKLALQLQKEYGVEIVPDIPALCTKVDAVLLESVDGRPHLAQVKPVLAARKPVFIDKPLASTYEDAREIAQLAKAAGVPWFSASALRFVGAAPALRSPDTTGAIVWGPGPTEEHHALSLAWYGIHPVEMLYTVMGRGCEQVTNISTGQADEVTCRWRDGRLGTVRALRPYSDYGAVVFRGNATEQGFLQSPAHPEFSYAPLVREIVRFFQTGQPPVPNEETLEEFAFMDAAQRSRAAGGAPMRLR